MQYSKKVSVGKVCRVMKSMSLPKMSTVKPRAASTKTDTAETIRLQNLLKGDFNPKAPNQVWVSYITYVRVSERFCYVCAIMDLFSRKIIAYKASVKIDTKLVLETFYTAYRKRNYPTDVMFHSDRGSQYTAKAFRQALDKANFVQSFSTKGHPYDNAVMESFFWYLKSEELNRRYFKSFMDLRLSLFEYIVWFYNPNRPHSANKMLSPYVKEDNFYC